MRDFSYTSIKDTYNESMMNVSDKPECNDYLRHMRSLSTFCCSKCAEVTVGSLVFFEIGRQKD